MNIFEKYEFLENQFDNNASYDGFMFETFGEELDFIKEVFKESPNRVWT